MKPIVFRTHTALRSWFERHHALRSELWIGFYRKGTGRTCVSYSDALDIALCYGWIDGVRRKVDEITYTNRFTPRRARSNWSHVNIRRANVLIAKGDMQPAGLAAFNARSAERTSAYSFERQKAVLEPEMLRRFKAKKRAWAFFDAQAPWYRRTAAHWVVSAKRVETRESRFTKLVALCSAGRFIGPIAQGGKKPRSIPPKRKPV